MCVYVCACIFCVYVLCTCVCEHCVGMLAEAKNKAPDPLYQEFPETPVLGTQLNEQQVVLMAEPSMQPESDSSIYNQANEQI